MVSSQHQCAVLLKNFMMQVRCSAFKGLYKSKINFYYTFNASDKMPSVEQWNIRNVPDTKAIYL